MSRAKRTMFLTQKADLDDSLIRNKVKKLLRNN